MFASQEGHKHVVEALLKGGATVDIQDKVIRQYESSLDSRSSFIMNIYVTSNIVNWRLSDAPFLTLSCGNSVYSPMFMLPAKAANL